MSFGRFGRFSRQRGILDLSFGAEETETAGEREEETERTVEAREETTRTAETEERQVSETVTTALPEDIQLLLEELIVGEAEGDDLSDAIAELGNLLTERAAGAEEAIASDVEAIVAAAQRRGEQDIQRTITNLAQASGSSQQSFVQQIGLEAGANLETELAALASESAILGRSAATEEFNAALNALLGASTAQAAETQQLVSLTNALRGTTVTQTGEVATTGAETEAEITTQMLTEIIESLISTTGESTTVGGEFGISL